MAKSSNQKIKLLYLMQILEKETDEDHPLSRRQLEEMLADQGIRTERKSLYNDMDTLKNFGMDIRYKKEHPEGYYLASGRLYYKDLRLLIEVVQSSRFLTKEKADELTAALGKMTSRYRARELEKDFLVADRIRSMSESIYEKTDRIHTAISSDRQIMFKYYEWTVSKEIRLKKGGGSYRISPWILTWDEENCCLTGYDMEEKKPARFRVDRMLHIRLLDRKREDREFCDRFDEAGYTARTFGMSDGPEKTVRIRFHNSCAGDVIDRFGRNVPLSPDGSEHFIACVKVTAGEAFYGWITGFGRNAQILSPESAVEEYQSLLYDLGEIYKKDKG